MTLSMIASKLAEKCRSIQDIDLSASLPEEFFYDSLDLCVIDAVFSIGVNYESVKNNIAKYRAYVNEAYPDFSKNRATKDSIAIFEKYESIDAFARDVLNLQRTSTTNGILKADAVLRVLKVLDTHGITNIEAFKNIDAEEQKSLDKDILAVKGQGSGIMLKYLYMLVGNDDVCKPDRMLHRFVSSISGRNMSDKELQDVLTEACAILKKDFPTLTVRILDNQIWQYQKSSS